MGTVKRVLEKIELGEGPHWDVNTQCLYYVDVLNKAIHKYDPTTNKDTKAQLEEHVSFIIPIQGAPNKFIISQNRNIVVATWDGFSETVSNIEKIAELDTNADPANRINDAKCDASGRLWAGTIGKVTMKGEIGPGMGSLYYIDANKGVKWHIGNVTCSNGLAWNSDSTKMYYIDSLTREIHQYDFNLESGTISNKEVVFSLNDLDITGFPDGQTIDSDGNLWIALFNGHKVIQIDPRKKNTLLREIDIPAKQVTSVAFGGRNLDELYVTTACFEMDGELPPDHGGLYKVTGLGVKGLPAVHAVIN